MIIEHIFSNFLAVEKLTIDNTVLLEYASRRVLYDKQIRNDKYSQSNFLDLDDPAISNLVVIVEQKFNELHASIGLSTNYVHKVSEAWVNINNNLNIDSPHCHPGSVFSAVYYVNTDHNSSNLIFMNPDKSKCHTIHPVLVDKFNCLNSHNYNVVPTSGDLIIFSAHLDHYVQTNSSTVDRVSIAFNSKITQIN
jgi:uncharacterized protein (TIGR02466 family)